MEILLLRTMDRLTTHEVDELQDVRSRIGKCNGEMQSSTSLLFFKVEDNLSLAQIKANKFTLHEDSFNLSKALEEIKAIQVEAA